MSVSRIALTGATGFIGGAILRELLAAGNREVTVLLRADSRRERLPEGEYGIVEYWTFRDEESAAALKSRRPEVFLHCGWRGVGGAERNEAYQIADNVPLTIESVDLAAAAGCKQWIGFGSQAEYGNQNRRLDETAVPLPTTVYGKGKLAAGIAARALCEARGMAGAWLRVFSTYGPDDAPAWLIPYLIQEFLAGRSPKLTLCEQRWDYLYVQDAARAAVAAANGITAGVYNLGSGTARPLRDYVEAIRGAVNSGAEPAYGAVAYRPDQVMYLEADISKLQAATGWKPETELSDGIAATVAFERKRAGLAG